MVKKEDTANDQADNVSPISEHLTGQPRKERRLRRGIYLLPNLITTGALFCGFYSIIAAMSGALEKAAIAIVVAGLLDALDGRIARMTNTQSSFGVQYDSLSDLVAFGVAPAILAFSWALRDLDNLGWMISFLYMACGALRLARFNTQPDNSTFTGLASPGAAGLLACAVWVYTDLTGLGVHGPLPDTSIQLGISAAVLTASLALLMVSNIRYYSLKAINFKDRVPFIYMLAVVMFFVVIFIYPPGVMLAMSFGYAISGPFQALLRRYRKVAGRE